MVVLPLKKANERCIYVRGCCMFRTGNSGTVRVRSDIEPTLVEATGTAPGTHSVFDLRADATKFFIGGIPSTATGVSLSSCCVL